MTSYAQPSLDHGPRPLGCNQGTAERPGPPFCGWPLVRPDSHADVTFAIPAVAGAAAGLSPGGTWHVIEDDVRRYLDVVEVRASGHADVAVGLNVVVGPASVLIPLVNDWVVVLPTGDAASVIGNVVPQNIQLTALGFDIRIVDGDDSTDPAVVAQVVHVEVRVDPKADESFAFGKPVSGEPIVEGDLSAGAAGVYVAGSGVGLGGRVLARWFGWRRNFGGTGW